MSVMSIRIDDNKRRALKVIASIEGKSMGGIVSELIEDYIKQNKERYSSSTLNCLNDVLVNLVTDKFFGYPNSIFDCLA